MRNPFENESQLPGAPFEGEGGDQTLQAVAENREEICAATIDEIGQEMDKLHQEDDFHNRKHSVNVGSDAAAFLRIAKEHGALVTQEDEIAGELASETHDIHTDFSIEENPNAWNFGQRIRHRGFGDSMPKNISELPEVAQTIDGRKIGNEERSFLFGEEVAKEHDPEGIVYTPKVLTRAREAVAATYPDVKPIVLPENYRSLRDPRTNETIDITRHLIKSKDGEPMVVIFFDQPLLTAESKATPFAVAYGDLMYGGKHDFEYTRQRGNEEYRETREVFSAMIRGKVSAKLEKLLQEEKLPESIRQEIAGGWRNLSSQRKAEIVRDAIGWSERQVDFHLGQLIRHDTLKREAKFIERSRDRKGLLQALDREYGNFVPNIVDLAKRAEATREEFGNLTEPDAFESAPDADERFGKFLQGMGYEIK